MAAINAPSSDTTASPTGVDDLLRVALAGDDAFEHLTSELVGEGAGLDELLQGLRRSPG